MRRQHFIIRVTGKVSVVGINTLGVLYILDNKGEVTNVSDLKGRTIYTTGKGNYT